MDNIGFWLDLELNHRFKSHCCDYVIVESDDEKYPLIAIYEIKNNDTIKEIEKAEKLIKKLEAGKLDYKKLGSSFASDFIKSMFPNFNG